MPFIEKPNKRIILASASPRRQQLFKLIVDAFEIYNSEIKEEFSPKDTPAEIVMKLAREKAENVAREIPAGLTVGADSLVVFEDQILGKPDNLQEAERMLRLLSGGWHQVFTGFSIIETPGKQVVTDYVETRVRFRHIEDWEIQRYLVVGEPMDKAGAYGIQNEAAIFIAEIAGCYYNVMGLPVSTIYQAILPLLK